MKVANGDEGTDRPTDHQAPKTAIRGLTDAILYSVLFVEIESATKV